MRRYLPLLLLIAFLIVYLEWSGDNTGFIFQMEYDFFTKDLSVHTLFHPMIIFPLTGQLLLLASVFFQNRRVIITSILLLGFLVFFILLIGIMALNWKIVLSTLPFLGLSAYYIVQGWKKNRKASA
jgi:hypothetical protein